MIMTPRRAIRRFGVFCVDSSMVEHQSPRVLEEDGSNPSPRIPRRRCQRKHAEPNELGGEGSSPSRRAKLYTIGRRDLPPGLRVAQMFHSLRQYASQYPFVESQWYQNSNTIVLLEVADRSDLEELAFKAKAKGVTITEFSEPGFIDDGLTALTLGPDATRLVSSIPLALKNDP